MLFTLRPRRCRESSARLARDCFHLCRLKLHPRNFFISFIILLFVLFLFFFLIPKRGKRLFVIRETNGAPSFRSRKQLKITIFFFSPSRPPYLPFVTATRTGARPCIRVSRADASEFLPAACPSIFSVYVSPRYGVYLVGSVLFPVCHSGF